ncbi:scavenger receptor class B member 1 [Anopheles cruzii]|uniref:scavenger receptor class B member 1 n=1 Tax=Anopheles cruzii TaxID=68878 RepID=UPI0022EC7D5A|nr:scavenger receptor class B member 1 [Anopheles cruzii]
MRDFASIFGGQYQSIFGGASSGCGNAGIECGSSSSSGGGGGGCTPQRRRSESLGPFRRRLRSELSLLDYFFHQPKHGRHTRYPNRTFMLMAAGFMFIICGTVLHILDPYLLIFKWKLKFQEGSEIFNLWRTPPVDLYIKIYLFNVTNAEDFLAGRAEKMQIEEVGPYVYRELMSHDELVFNDNGTVSTKPHHPLIFQKSLSGNLREDDVFMMPNIALLSIAHVASKKPYFLRWPINMLVRQTEVQPLERQTAREFMYGYPTTLTTLGNTFLPHWISFDKVGLIDRMYDFDDDFETFYTGESSAGMSGLYDTYLGSPDLAQWDGKHCSNIRNASDGTKFKSFIEPTDQLLFFRKSMCRPQRLIQNGTDYEVDGLKATRFVFERNALDNGEYDPRNKCYCRKGHCLPRGLIDVTSCYYGFPIALSYPHFLDADPKVLAHVNGSRPDPVAHQSHFMINPVSGLPLQLSVKFQINMVLDDLSGITHCERFSNLVVPALWFEITMPGLPKTLLSRFIFYLKILPVGDLVVKHGLLAFGGILLLVAITKVSLTLSSAYSSAYRISNELRESLW